MEMFRMFFIEKYLSITDIFTANSTKGETRVKCSNDKRFSAIFFII